MRVEAICSRNFVQKEELSQGDVSSVMCFTVSINSIFSILENINSSLFVDDVPIFWSVCSVEEACSWLQTAWSRIVKWAAEHEFTSSS